jgi:hypothetical protein
MASPATTSGRRPWVLAAIGLAGLVTLFPALRMTRIVLGGSELQYADYWMMLVRFTNPDGSLRIAGLFEFQNHPVVIPQALYWLNIELFSGSNVTLGLVVVALGLGQVVVVGLMLRHGRFHLLDRIVLLVLASAMVFNLNGTWNFAKAMSGTAWLSANLFALVAVYLAARSRPLPALGAAALSAVSYGTGLMAWPALIATGMARRPWREWWREWPAVIGFVATFAWYRSVAGDANPVESPGIEATVRSMAGILAYPFGLEGGRAVWVGGLALGAIPLLALGIVGWARSAAIAPWVGMAAFGWLATLEMVVGRSYLGLLDSAQYRYTSLPALAWLGLAGMVVHSARLVGARLASGRRGPVAALLSSPWPRAALVAPVVLAALLTGTARVTEMEESTTYQQLGEISWRLGMTTSSAWLVAPFEPADVAGRLEVMGHHPFVAGWDLDCGLFGQRVEVASGEGAPEPAGEIIDGGRMVLLEGNVLMRGRMPDGLDLRCIVITDGHGEVVGAAVPGTIDAAHEVGRPGEAWVGVAHGGRGPYQVYAVPTGGQPPLLLARGYWVPADGP